MDIAEKGKPLKRNWISSDNSTKQRHKDYVKANVDKTPQNNGCRLCGDGDETIDHMISENSKLAAKGLKTRHDWVGKVINWELCQRFCPYKQLAYAHPGIRPGMPKILWGFQIQTDQLISAKRLDLVIVKKKQKKKKQI